MSIQKFMTKQSVVTPLITASVAYSAGGQIGPASSKLTRVSSEDRGAVSLQSILVVDKGKQKSALDVLFWNTLPGVTTADQAALSFPIANSPRYAGAYSILAADYKDTALASVVAIKDINLFLQGVIDSNNPQGQDLYVSFVSRGTPTYLTTSDLVFTFNFLEL